MIVEAEFDEIEGTADQLDLSEADSLPWLEADEEDDNAGGVDTAQVIGFVMILLTILVGVVGTIWYFGSRADDADMVADGSVIEAPETPIKERPENPGGKEFDGTGNVAPVVAEGGTRDGVLATGGADTATPATTPTGATGTGGEAARPASALPATGVGVQLAAYSSRSRAEQGWSDLSRRTDALSGVRYRIEEGVVDIGKVYRLQAVASDRAAADRLCAALKADGLDCQVKP